MKNIPKKFQNAEFFDNKPTRRALKAFLEGKSIFITGTVGSGKTHVACAFLNQYEKLFAREDKVAKGRTYAEVLKELNRGQCAFIKASRLFDMIKDSWEGYEEANMDGLKDFRFNNYGDPPTEKEILNYYSEIPVLVLDDLGAGMDTKWVRSTLCSLIDKRYEEELQTIVTSNFSIKQLAKEIDERIASRFLEMAEIIPMENIDYRADRGEEKIMTDDQIYEIIGKKKEKEKDQAEAEPTMDSHEYHRSTWVCIDPYSDS